MKNMKRSEAEVRFGYVPESAKFIVTNGIVIRFATNAAAANAAVSEFSRTYGLQMEQIKLQNISKE